MKRLLRVLEPRVRAFFLAPTAPINLAVFRIVVFLEIARFSFGVDTAWFASLPQGLLFPPKGWNAIAPHLLVGDAAGTAIGLLFKLAAICALIGFATRISTAIVAVVGVYAMGLPELFGKIDHWHHLLWFAMLLACSPCGEALSVDALLRRREPRAVSAFPLRVTWILIGFLYFFPGLAKWRHVFRDWVYGDHLKLILHSIWSGYGPDYTPALRIDQWPTLYRAAGLATILFELAFIFLILHRRTRPLAVLGGLAFHLGVDYVMDINFRPLWICYVVFIDWSFIRRWRVEKPLAVRAPSRVAATVGVLLLSVNAFFGNFEIDNWPFACYPTFAHYPAAHRNILHLEMLDANGQPVMTALPPTLRQQFGPARLDHLLRRLTHSRPGDGRLTAFLMLLQREGVPIERARTIRIYRDRLTTDPDRQKAPLLARKLMVELTR